MNADPALHIDLNATVPAYRQIANGLRTLLVTRYFGPGDQLPTVRELAADLGVNHNTVAEAYRTLASEGWLSLGRRQGAVVLDRQAPKPDRAEEEWFSSRLQELVAEARGAGVPASTLAGWLNELASDLKQAS